MARMRNVHLEKTRMCQDSEAEDFSMYLSLVYVAEGVSVCFSFPATIFRWFMTPYNKVRNISVSRRVDSEPVNIGLGVPP